MVRPLAERDIWKQLATVVDPELPFLNVVEMGMVREIAPLPSGGWSVRITPTYSGCPATDVIMQDIRSVLGALATEVQVEVVHHPAWTTDWIGEEARNKMAAHGIAPPIGSHADKSFLLGKKQTVPCPLCGSSSTRLVSAFGSTACKAHYTCNECLEPFDHFKCF